MMKLASQAFIMRIRISGSGFASPLPATVTRILATIIRVVVWIPPVAGTSLQVPVCLVLPRVRPGSAPMLSTSGPVTLSHGSTRLVRT
ncbi:hypothetical protein H4582DRAFT_1908698 [Lactarius indigo]|nr:hypothetical protein H4582DRAFT_1908698 [Lactarius indigo]